MADQASKLPVLDGADGTDGSTAPSVAIQVAGKDFNGNLQTIFTDTTGRVYVDLCDGLGNSITSTLVGAKQSIDTNISQQATFSDKTGSGTINALNGTIVATTNGCSIVSFSVTGTWSATIVTEGTLDNGATWVAIDADIDATDTIINSFTVNSLVTVNCSSYGQVRLRSSIFASGTLNAIWSSASGLSLVEVYNTNAASLQTTSRIQDSTGNTVAAISNQIQVRDVINISSQFRAQSVTTTAAQALGAATILANRKVLTITPTNGTIYWGTSNAVTTTTGTPLFAFQTLTLTFTDNVPVWVIAAATVDARIMEGS